MVDGTALAPEPPPKPLRPPAGKPVRPPYGRLLAPLAAMGVVTSTSSFSASPDVISVLAPNVRPTVTFVFVFTPFATTVTYVWPFSCWTAAVGTVSAVTSLTTMFTSAEPPMYRPVGLPVRVTMMGYEVVPADVVPTMPMLVSVQARFVVAPVGVTVHVSPCLRLARSAIPTVPLTSQLLVSTTTTWAAADAADETVVVVPGPVVVDVVPFTLLFTVRLTWATTPANGAVIVAPARSLWAELSFACAEASWAFAAEICADVAELEELRVSRLDRAESTPAWAEVTAEERVVVSSVASTWPATTLWPRVTLTAETVPAAGKLRYAWFCGASVPVAETVVRWVVFVALTVVVVVVAEGVVAGRVNRQMRNPAPATTMSATTATMATVRFRHRRIPRLLSRAGTRRPSGSFTAAIHGLTGFPLGSRAGLWSPCEHAMSSRARTVHEYGLAVANMHFERMADEYALARPPYPRELYGTLVRLGVVGEGTRVLEVGAGSGLATADLVALGAHVTALEPGQRLATLLRERVPEATVHVTTLEAADLQETAYDSAVAATALHWVDLDAGLPILHRALRPGGHLAVWRTVFGDREAPRSRFREEVDAIVARRPAASEPTAPEPTVSRDDRPTVEELTAGGWFTHVDTSTWRWGLDLSTRQVHRLFSTFSNWTAAEVDAAAEAADRCGGTVAERCVSVLHELKAT